MPSTTTSTSISLRLIHVHECGQVNLHGKSMEERIELLISIAHPDHRERLRKEAFHG